MVSHKDQFWDLYVLVYMNDLPSVSEVLPFYLFVDNASIYYEAKDLISLQKKYEQRVKKK